MSFHFNIIKTYTGALLELFGSVKLINDDVVPIKYSSMEKASLFKAIPPEIIHSGNLNILPRMCLIFSGMSAAWDRSTNKHNLVAKNKLNEKTTQIQYNSVPYDFTFQVIAQARGMEEACIITEQIASFFNPSYPLKIREIPFQINETTIPLELQGISFETEEYDDFSTNIVTVTFDLTLKGNIYPAILDTANVEQINIFLNNIKNKIQLSNAFKITKNTFETYDYNNFNDFNITIKDIKQNKTTLRALYECDNLYEKYLTFKWSIEGVNYITSANRDMAIITDNKGSSKVILEIINNNTSEKVIFEKVIIIR